MTQINFLEKKVNMKYNVHYLLVGAKPLRVLQLVRSIALEKSKELSLRSVSLVTYIASVLLMELWRMKLREFINSSILG